MKATICTYLFMLCVLASVAQSSIVPVRWKVTTERLGEGRYRLTAHAHIDSNWYIYAKTDTALGLQAPSLSWTTGAIQPLGDLEPARPAGLLHDKIFGANLPVVSGSSEWYQDIRLIGPSPDRLPFEILVSAANGKAFLQLTDTMSVFLDSTASLAFGETVQIKGVDLKNPAAQCGQPRGEKRSLWLTFLLGFLGGLLALCTPCVFPMVPVTVSFFTGRSKNGREAVRNGLLYGCSIVLIYLLASLPFHLVGGLSPQLLNSIATNAWVNLFFFLVFLVFAISLFGVFGLRLPAAITNYSGTKSSLRSLAGIFFMALTLSVVSFSCTGPILGSLLVGSLASGGAWRLSLGMGGFGLALGLPFALFALFPQFLKRLPKSGSWMEVVKKSLAFVELALALKFLSNADLVEHWGLLKREVFIGIWILISLGLTSYLLGIFQPGNYRRPPFLQIVAGTVCFLFTTYLLNGFSSSGKAGLGLVSGFPPPVSYSLFTNRSEDSRSVQPRVVNDYQRALALAKRERKPLLIDFTGWACVNCRKMEEHVWTDPDVRQRIDEDFILVSLYVDDRRRTSSGLTTGEMYARMEALNFGQATQPLYVILSPQEHLLNYPVGYTPEAGKYRDWLDCGRSAMSAKDL